MNITRKTVDNHIQGTTLASHESNENKGVYRKDAGPAHSFRTLGKTWREVYIALLIAEGTAAADKTLRALGVEN